MGNQPSSEAHRATRPPPPALTDRPLPPLPRASRSNHHANAHTHARSSRPNPRPSTVTSHQASASANKLAKPRARAHSTAGLTKSSDGLAKSAPSGRFTTSNLASLVSSTFAPKTSSSATSSASRASRPLPSLPSSSSLSAANSGLPSPSVFTFEEAVAAVTGQREPAAWRPMADVYPTPSLDLELLQQQQARQLEFQQRQRLNQIQLQQQKRLSKTQNQLRDGLPQEYGGFDFHLDNSTSAGITGDDELVSASPVAFEFDIEDEKHAEREPRKLQRQQQLEKLYRRPFFRSRSSQRTAWPQNDFNDLDSGYPRRNSIGSVYSYAAGQHTLDGSMTYGQQSMCQYDRPPENWPTTAGSRTSWNYDMSSYAAKRLLHLVDDANDPVDRRYEQSSIASESRNSTVSEVTWKSSHPIQNESPAMKRANSDLSLYAPVRRASMMNIPGVATRRNSAGSFGPASNMATASRPAFRHCNSAAPALSTTPDLLQKPSYESSEEQELVMPVFRRHNAIIRDAGESVARVSTPTDHDNIRYSTIGAYKLGSLRITNGDASPSSPELKQSDQTEVDVSSPVHNPDLECKARSMALAALSGNAPADMAKSAPSPTSLHITKHEGRLSRPALQLRLDLLSRGQPVVVEPVTTPAEPPQVELSDDVFAGFEFISSFPLEDPATVQVPPQGQLPCDATSAAPMELLTTSKATAMEDLLFEEDDRSTLEGYSGAEVLDVRLDPSAKATAKRGRAGILATQKSGHSVQSVSRSDCGFVSSPTSESSHKPLSKADSGYSSNVSLRSFKQAASKLMAPVSKAANRLSTDRSASSRTPGRESFVIDELNLPSTSFDDSEMSFQSAQSSLPSQRRPVPATTSSCPPPALSACEAPAVQRQPLNISPKDVFPLTPAAISLADSSAPVLPEPPLRRLVRSSTSPARMNKKCPPLPAPIGTARLDPGSYTESQESSRSGRNPLTPSSIQSNGSASAVSTGSGMQRPNKLLRFLSFSGSSTGDSQKGTMAVHSMHIAKGDKGSAEAVTRIADKPWEHRGRTPIATQRLALKSQMSRDTLKTIFSVGSLENHGSCGDLHASSTKDGGAHIASRVSVRRKSSTSGAAVADGATKRKSRLSTAVGFSDEPEVSNDPEAHRSKTFTSSTLAEAIEDSKARMTRMSWRRWGKEVPQPHALETGFGSGYDGCAMGNNTLVTASSSNEKTRARSSSIIERTMSMTAQFERTLSLKLSFPRLSHRSHGHQDQGDTYTAASEAPAFPLVSAFSTALHDQGQLLSSSPLPGTMTQDAAVTRKQNRRPSMIRISPPLRTMSTPPTEAGSKQAVFQIHREGRREIPPALRSPVDPKWEVKTDHDTSDSLQFSRRETGGRGSMDSMSRTYNGPYVPHRSFSSDTTQCVNIAAMEENWDQYAQYYDGADEQPQSRHIRYCASYDGGSSNSIQQGWDDNEAAPPSQHDPAHMYNASQIQQTHTRDGSYQQYAQPPVAHSRAGGREARHGPTPGPQPGAQPPYRILHSYNSPAYRGVPIWG